MTDESVRVSGINNLSAAAASTRGIIQQLNVLQANSARPVLSINIELLILTTNTTARPLSIQTRANFQALNSAASKETAGTVADHYDSLTICHKRLHNLADGAHVVNHGRATRGSGSWGQKRCNSNIDVMVQFMYLFDD
jgi:hypothetical protein